MLRGSRWQWLLWIPLIITTQVGAKEPATERLNADSVYALLDVVETIVAENLDYKDTRSALRELGESDLHQRLTKLAADNAANPRIAAGVDQFLATEARTIYFRRFLNVTPDHFRRALFALPFVRTDAPGDIASPLYELTENANEIRTKLDNLVTKTDLDRCRSAAEKWLPVGSYETPSIYVVYDNNAGSYTAEGKAFYNLYAGEGASDLSEATGQAVMTHEVHHVLANPYFQSARRSNDRWELDRMDMIVRRMVSEGTAIHCSPPTGFKKALYEDPGTVRSLITEFNRQCLALLNGEVSEESHRAWYGSTFHDLPRRLLEEYVARQDGAEGDGAEIVRLNMPHRPDLVHALGWWMVSRISAEGSRPETVQSLVEHPYTLLSQYNQAMRGADTALWIDPIIVASFADRQRR